jgi:N-acetylmuramoyl-L-alanine amidase
MRVYIDPGHGGDDPGAVHGELVEQDIALSISGSLEENLRDLGHEVLLSRRDDVTISLHGRASMANEWKADVFLSIHLNADPDPDLPGMPEAHGHEFWIYPGSFKGLRLAEAINKAFVFAFPDQPARGIKEANFAVLRLTEMPAVLLELAFIDTALATRLKQPVIQARIAGAISSGVHYYKISGVG